MIKTPTLLLLASAFTISVVHAQPSGDASSQRQPIFNSKSQLRAEKQKDARPAGQVKATGGDERTSELNDDIGDDKSGKTAQRRVAAREKRYPGRTPTPQGGTPDLPGAK